MHTPVVHWEMLSKDPDKVSGFYEKVFGWKIQDMPEFNYRIVDTGGEAGINGGIEAGSSRAMARQRRRSTRTWTTSQPIRKIMMRAARSSSRRRKCPGWALLALQRPRGPHDGPGGKRRSTTAAAMKNAVANIAVKDLRSAREFYEASSAWSRSRRKTTS